RNVRREALSPALGFPKSHHTHCCMQYKDKLRFAFGQIVGPKALEGVRKSLRGNYSHPFWRLYNVGYIVDRFDTSPELLPEDPALFERLSEFVIKIREPRPIVYFMDRFEDIELDLFLDEVREGGLLDMEDKLYVHGYEGKPVAFGKGKTHAKASIEITEFKSGTLRAKVTADRAGFVVFSEVWAPSWTVYVDGERAEVTRAYGMLQAVWVEAGTHEVLFEYNIFKSLKMKLAVLLSSMTFLFVLIVFVRRLLRGLDRGH
ncbi:MAG: hypothetical protein IME98_04455, partial [Proteobacteria bacterium]|nr:hypothetical protein [Pseudomonadota bacterium]